MHFFEKGIVVYVNESFLLEFIDVIDGLGLYLINFFSKLLLNPLGLI